MISKGHLENNFVRLSEDVRNGRIDTVGVSITTRVKCYTSTSSKCYGIKQCEINKSIKWRAQEESPAGNKNGITCQ